MKILMIDAEKITSRTSDRFIVSDAQQREFLSVIVCCNRPTPINCNRTRLTIGTFSSRRPMHCRPQHRVGSEVARWVGRRSVVGGACETDTTGHATPILVVHAPARLGGPSAQQPTTRTSLPPVHYAQPPSWRHR